MSKTKAVSAETGRGTTQTTGAVTSASGPKSALEGKVLLINRNFNFVVINLGSKHGLNVGDILVIKKNGRQIAKVRVEKLYDEYSAAYITEEENGSEIAESDAVSQ